MANPQVCSACGCEVGGIASPAIRHGERNYCTECAQLIMAPSRGGASVPAAGVARASPPVDSPPPPSEVVVIEEDAQATSDANMATFVKKTVPAEVSIEEDEQATADANMATFVKPPVAEDDWFKSTPPAKPARTQERKPSQRMKAPPPPSSRRLPQVVQPESGEPAPPGDPEEMGEVGGSEEPPPPPRKKGSGHGKPSKREALGSGRHEAPKKHSKLRMPATRGSDKPADADESPPDAAEAPPPPPSKGSAPRLMKSGRIGATAAGGSASAVSSRSKDRREERGESVRDKKRGKQGDAGQNNNQLMIIIGVCGVVLVALLAYFFTRGDDAATKKKNNADFVDDQDKTPSSVYVAKAKEREQAGDRLSAANFYEKAGKSAEREGNPDLASKYSMHAYDIRKFTSVPAGGR